VTSLIQIQIYSLKNAGYLTRGNERYSALQTQQRNIMYVTDVTVAN